MPQVLPTGHRRKGSGLTTDNIPDLERAIIYSRHKGRDVYVDSNCSVSNPSGGSFGDAYPTLAAYNAYALAGDRVHVAEGHVETVATAGAITFSKAGVTVYGYGRGTRRPTITMSAVASSVKITGAAVELNNLLFLSAAACTIVLDIDATDVLVGACEFRRSSGTVPVVWIDVGSGGSANGCDRLKIYDCIMNTGTNVGATGFIELGAVADQVEIAGCTVFGDFGDACIHNPTGFVLTNLLIADSLLTNVQTGDHSIELVSACTGNLVRCLYHNDMTQATGSDPGSCFTYQCFHDDVIDTSAIVSPAVT